MAKILFTVSIICLIFAHFPLAQTMKVHTQSGVDEFNLADIDSITFTIIDTTNLNVGLVAYYPFNGNANDESGNGNDGTIFGAVLTNDRLGNPNSAYLFDGIDDYIDIGNNSTLKPQLPVSFSCWINYPVFGLRMPMFTNNYDANDSYFGVWTDVDPQNKIAIGYGDGGSIGSSSRRTKRSSMITQAGIWYHIVGIIRGPQDMEIYINGINNNGTYDGTGGGLSYSTGNGNIARQDASIPGPENYFNGTIDELRIYNRVLTEAEIQALYVLY